MTEWCNCVIPHSNAIMEHFGRLGGSATVIDALNRVVRRNGSYFGEKTEGPLRTMIDAEAASCSARVVRFSMSCRDTSRHDDETRFLTLII